jgi:hypothetical protein
LTIEDPLHSTDEERFVIIGKSIRRRVLVVVHTERGDHIRIISARVAARQGELMKKKAEIQPDPEMLDEYDFTKGVRGKYAERYAGGSNVVVLSPDVAEVFPDSESVNEALRTLIKIARQTSKKVPV